MRKAQRKAIKKQIKEKLDFRGCTGRNRALKENYRENDQNDKVWTAMEWEVFKEEMRKKEN